MMINGRKIERKNLIHATIFFSIFLLSIFSLLANAHEEEEVITVNPELTVSISPTPANKNVVLDFYIKDDQGPIPPSQLQITHTKLIHLIGVRNDLTNFFHTHPEPSSLDGHYAVNYSFPADGVYTLWYEFRHDDTDYVKGFRLSVGSGQTFTLQNDFSTEKIVQGYRVEIVPESQLIVNRENKIVFEISDVSTGSPVKLGTYLGALGHIVVINSELNNFVHTHADGGEHEEHEVKTIHLPITGKHVETSTGIPGEGHLTTAIKFPQEGIYKIFVEFNPTPSLDENIVRAEFMVNVQKTASFNPFYIVFVPFLILSVVVTVAIARYGEKGTLFAPKQSTQAAAETQKPELSDSEKKFKKTLLIIGFILFSIFVIGMLWLASGYKIDESRNDILFWFILSYTAGLSMIFLPCTLPLAFVIVPLCMGEKPKKGFIMAIMFGLGLTITITTYGILMATIGKILGFDRSTQIMWLVAGFISFFLGLGNLKLIPLKVPGYSGALPEFFQKQGDYLKSFLMGLFLGNAGAGCPNPAFYVLLTYITTVGSIINGALLGFVHGVGRALPLIFLAIAGILGINATQSIVKHKEKVEKGIGFMLVFIGVFILMLGIYGKAWWENSIVHKVWSEFLAIINPEFGEAAAGTGSAPLTPFYILFAITALIILWYYLDRKYFSEQEAPVEGVEPKPDDKTIEQQILEEMKKLEEKETKLEQLEEEQIKELKEMKSILKKEKRKKK